MQTVIRIQEDDFDLAKEYANIRQSSKSIGAIVNFIGLVREFESSVDSDGNKIIDTLNLQHYPQMTERLLHDIVEQAHQRWSIQSVTVIHRVGSLAPSEQIVLVLVAAQHRGAAFASAEFIMDYLKTKAPFWKSVQQGKQTIWIDQKNSDSDAADRWSKGSAIEASAIEKGALNKANENTQG